MLRCVIICLVASVATVALADERWQFEAIAALTGQCLDSDGDDACRGAALFQPTVSFAPGERHLFSATVGAGLGDALAERSPFAVDPWPADIESSLKNINGTDRDYLLTAWYRYEGKVSATVGLLDATAYLNTNALANDELGQFLAGIFVNAPNALLPSYAPGVAIEWSGERLAVAAVYMRVGQVDAERFDFGGVELTLNTEAGSYRLLVDTTSDDLPDGDSVTRRHTGWGISADRRLSQRVAAFVRTHRGNEERLVAFETLLSGGLQIEAPRGRVGVAYGRLSGGQGRAEVVEAYYRLAFDRGIGLTFDMQHHDEDDRDGWIFGLRTTVAF